MDIGVSIRVTGEHNGGAHATLSLGAVAFSAGNATASATIKWLAEGKLAA